MKEYPKIQAYGNNTRLDIIFSENGECTLLASYGVLGVESSFWCCPELYTKLKEKISDPEELHKFIALCHTAIAKLIADNAPESDESIVMRARISRCASALSSILRIPDGAKVTVVCSGYWVDSQFWVDKK